MRIQSENIIPAGALSLTASSNLAALWIGHAALVALHFVVTGTPVGTFKIQASCDVGNVNAQSLVNQSATVTNWVDVGTSVAVSSAGSYFINVVDPGYHWLRVVYTATSSTGSLTVARCNTKGF